MLNSTTLEVAIGLALIFLLLSLLCTAINEAIAGFLSTRSKMLEAGIRSLFSGGTMPVLGSDGVAVAKPLADLIYNHGLVQGLYRSQPGQTVEQALKAKLLPSYIPSRTFASALMDLLFTHTQDAAPTLQSMIADLQALPESKAREALITLVTQSQGNLQRTRTAIEAWYDDGMDRVSGWYKRRSQAMLLVIGLSMAVILNIDSIHVARTLWNTPAFRSYAVTTAESYGKTTVQSTSSEQINLISHQLSDLETGGLPLGWHAPNYPWSGAPDISTRILLILTMLAGWVLTALAVSLGAPFWFDLLNQFMVIRSTIKPAEKSGTEASKDPVPTA